MVEVQSNNPYRRSMSPQLPPPAAGQQQQQQHHHQQYQLSSYSSTDSGSSSPSPPPHSHSHSPSPPPLVKFPSSTTTIAEEPENELDAQSHVRSPTPTIVVKACEDKERDGADKVFITIHPTGSTNSVPQHKEYPMPVRTNTHPHPRQSMNEACSVWPARRFMQKQVMQKKTKWIIIKVLCALIFVVGAVAIGFGISKAAGSK
ncbi:uncharacterized protein H6S33_005209 [Morchella sextelata]|jgi:hypothetical protein|uniref:uncharacterized protein n=1 Tax=Morchella sextelata TaxID=1174677 RepID=UPI001D03DE36|nr:uncharacterized protein H6S33_005209 [Morchella sextelata]KAH0605227.1 hypothetical protein H6S33_005209 [Morchella sextelata]